MNSKSTLVAVPIALIVVIAAFFVAVPHLNNNDEPQDDHGTVPVTPLGTDVSVYVWNVGEALSILIDDQDTEILIDAGNDRDGPTIVDNIKPYVTDGTIEYVIATHSDADHIGGMEYVYNAYYIENTIYGNTGTSAQFKQFWDAATAEGSETFAEDSNMTIQLPGGATLEILDITDNESDANNNSVISVLTCGEHRMLITGDLQDASLKRLGTALTGRLQSEGLYPMDVYMVGHHGSETSSSQGLLDLIKPTYAVISSEGPSGKYQNPNEGVMERLVASGAKIFATYVSGNITITFSPDGVTLSPPDSQLLTVENYRDMAAT